MQAVVDANAHIDANARINANIHMSDPYFENGVQKISGHFLATQTSIKVASAYFRQIYGNNLHGELYKKHDTIPLAVKFVLTF